MSRSYPNSPNIPESEYVAPYVRSSAVEYDQQYQYHQQEMTNMHSTLHHHQGFFGSGSNIHPMGGSSGMDSGYHSQNGPFSQSAPTETVFHGQHGPFNNSMRADSGYSSQNGGYNPHSPNSWGEQTPHIHPHMQRQFSEPVQAQQTYERMDRVPLNHNQSCVEV